VDIEYPEYNNISLHKFFH